MPKILQDCPVCNTKHLHVVYTVVRTRRCDICKILDQIRIVDGVEGGALLLAQLIDFFINDNANGSALEDALRQQLDKVQQHLANKKTKERR